MHQHFPFPVQHFKNYCDGLQRVGIQPGYIMFTNHHASNHRPATRLLDESQLTLAETHINSPSEETFKQLVASGVLLDTEWDYQTSSWQIIAFNAWETLHNAFTHLYAKSSETLEELVGVTDFSETL